MTGQAHQCRVCCALTRLLLGQYCTVLVTVKNVSQPRVQEWSTVSSTGPAPLNSTRRQDYTTVQSTFVSSLNKCQFPTCHVLVPKHPRVWIVLFKPCIYSLLLSSSDSFLTRSSYLPAKRTIHQNHSSRKTDRHVKLTLFKLKLLSKSHICR